MKLTPNATPLVALAVVGLAMALAGGPASAATTGRIDLLIGQRSLDNDFAPVDDATQLGLALSLGREGWPVRIALDVIQSGDDAGAAATLGGLPVTGSADVDVSEVDLGLRRFMVHGDWGWHYGGGVAFVDVDVESVIADSFGTLFEGEETDSSIGAWLSVGGSWHFAERLQAGIDLRYTDADVVLSDGDEFDAGAAQLSVTVGYRW